MKFCDKEIQNHLLNGGKIKRTCDNKDWDYRPIKLDDKLLEFADNEDDYVITRDDLTATNWEIVKPEYDWNKIIKDKILCVFWNNDVKLYKLGYMVDITERGTYVALVFGSDNGSVCVDYDYFKPFNPAEFNIAKNLKEYEK